MIALARFGLESDLYSYVVVVPPITIYLLWLRKSDLLARRIESAFALAAIPALVGAGLLVAYGVMAGRGWQPAESDYLALTISSWVSFVIAGFLFFFGRDMLRAAAFPIGFLLFMIPLPALLTNWFEEFLQRSSADAAAALLGLCGETVFRNGLVFQLPGIVIEVAKECSGIHSTFVLLITSLVAGHLFLRSTWKKSVLALAVIPLGILRNGFRIFTLATLCVHVNPNIIDSPLHHRGGPIFFALSLVPLFALLYVLRKSEGRKRNPSPVAIGPAGKSA
jgi:exosortase C (VPDSG-CTERM-specific)